MAGETDFVTEGFPSRIGTGDGPGAPCRVVAFDLAAETTPRFSYAVATSTPGVYCDRAPRDAQPNSCRYCGVEQRGHDGPHRYEAPGDALRLARMKARREDRLGQPVRVAGPEVFATFAVDTARLAEAFRRLGESVARAVEPMAAQIRAAALALGAASSGVHWPAEAAVCCHVCGPDPGHVCDARATTSITHPLPSGGTRVLPLCGPCRQAESAGAGVAS